MSESEFSLLSFCIVFQEMQAVQFRGSEKIGKEGLKEKIVRLQAGTTKKRFMCRRGDGRSTLSR
jgi:hypothetical protein